MIGDYGIELGLILMLLSLATFIVLLVREEDFSRNEKKVPEGKQKTLTPSPSHRTCQHTNCPYRISCQSA
ncbi:hypothetical protein [Effusibacillus lacus]|uniref:hypothetical protein n=1 Tax=Effusibacillus lacus TaxID=1348429 RepID=UPI000BB69435|nr:hypothetical protein [Effusibacillus lacus]TCS70519.1 hypothetical protein EDD64_13250 [Effusibacillus lacus]